MARISAQKILLTVLIGLFAASPVQAEIAPWLLEFLDRYNIPLRWDNVEGTPEWISGVLPRYSSEYKCHAVTFRPGEDVLIRVPSRSMVRVYGSTGDTLGDPTLKAFVSDGNGLFMERSVIRGEDGRSWLLHTGLEKNGLVRFFLPSSAGGPVQAALFVSRYESAGNPRPYRNLVELSAPVVQVREKYLDAGRLFQRLSAERPYQVRVKGPLRMLLEHRLVFGPDDRIDHTSYTIQGLLDTRNVLSFSSATRPESRALVQVEDEYPMVGYLRKSYFSIPGGEHILTVLPDRNVLVRLQALEEPDFLFPGLNDPFPLPGEKADDKEDPVLLFARSKEAVDVLRPDPGEYVNIEEWTRRIWKNNRYPAGGLSAAGVVAELARRYPGSDELARAERLAAGKFTFYRNLFPLSVGNNSGQVFTRFVSPALKEDTVQLRVLHKEALLSAANDMGRAYFSDIPTSKGPGELPGETGLTYMLPRRWVQSQLRILVESRTGSGSFMLQLGNQPEIRCDVLPTAIRPPEEFALDTGPAAAGLAWKLGAGLDPSLDRKGRADGPVLVSTLTVPLASDVERIAIRPLGKTMQPVRVALQYRDSSPFSLSESEFLLARKQLCRSMSMYELALKIYRNTDAAKTLENRPDREAIEDIEAFLLPLFRYIHTREIVFASSVSPLPVPRETTVFRPVEVDGVRRKLKSALKAGQWVVVLEHAMQLYRGTRGQDKIYAAMLVAEALEKSSESYLGEMWLRGLFLYPQHGGKGLRQMARHRLERLYQNRNDTNALINLYATCFSQNPSPLYLEKLAEMLLVEGRSHLALVAILLAPQRESNRELLIRAALQSDWYRTVQEAIRKITGPEEQKFWLGRLEEKRGNGDAALRSFTAAGKMGEKQAHSIEEAKAIREKLGGDEAEERKEALAAWEQWQNDLPGPFFWQSEPWHVHDHAGGVWLYSAAQDKKTLMYRATGDRPVRAAIWGPVTLRVTVRPLHAEPEGDGVSGWSRLYVDEELDLIPILKNRPVRQWQMEPGERTLPGRAVTFERRLGPGPHELSLSSSTLELLVAIQVRRAELNNTLPPLSHAAADAVLEAKGPGEPLQRAGETECLHRDCLALLSRESQAGPEFFFSSQFKINTEQVQPRRKKKPRNAGIRTGKVSSRHGDNPENDTYSAVARLMATGQWDAALDAAGQATDQERHQLLTLLLYLSESRPERQPEYESLARTLFEKYRFGRKDQTLFQQITGRTQWKQVRLVHGGAGLRLVPVAKWSPENPALRIRKALLASPLESDVVLAGDEQIVLSLENPTSSTGLEVSWRLSEVSYLHPEPMDIVYQLDNGRQRKITLEPDQPRLSLRLNIPPGRHRFVTGIASRYGNQFLQLRFQESVPSVHVPARGAVWLPQVRERSYHVVTSREPLTLSIQGPNTLRIDELRNGNVLSRYRVIGHGVQTITLRPEKNQKEMLVRLYKRVAKNSEAAKGRPRSIQRTYPELPPPLLVLPERAGQEGRIRFTDAYALGRQEDGTWSAGLSWYKRRAVEEDRAGGDGETFFQFSGSYHHLYDPMPTYLESTVFLRKRTHGGPTLGVHADVTRKYNHFPLTVRLTGDVVTQNPEAGETNFFDRDPTEWAALLQARVYQERPLSGKLKHRPMLTVFGRLMSLKDATRYEAGTVDQDIFTRYKADHRNGLRFSEYLSYRPRLDTVFFTRGSYTTNADMNPFHPDNIRISAGLGQLLGPLEVDFRYQFSHYFEDDDRIRPVDHNDLALGLTWDYWFRDQTRIQLGVKGYYRVDSDELSGMAGLTWFFSPGRGMKDLRPGRDLFYGLKASRASQLDNNEISDVDHSP